MPGGFYMVPLQLNLYNVNLVVRNDVVKKKLNLRTEFEKLIETNGYLKTSFKQATRVSSFLGSCLILGTKKRSNNGYQYMLFRACARLIDFISAKGIPQTMLSV